MGRRIAGCTWLIMRFGYNLAIMNDNCANRDLTGRSGFVGQ
ncbi:MAG: hypothetical protein Pars92KO_29090 [Parasphingorhabdus sp.]